MPLVNIDLLAGRSDDDIDRISDCVHEAMTAELDVPQRDRFQIVAEHTPRSLRFDRGYLDIDRTEEFVLIRINLSAGRSTEAKQAFYSRLAQLLHERIGIRTEDVAIVPRRERARGLVVRARGRELRGAAPRGVALSAGQCSALIGRRNPAG